MRKTFKKLLAMALAATMVVSMAACGGDEGTTGNATPTTPATSGSENAGTTEKKDLEGNITYSSYEYKISVIDENDKENTALKFSLPAILSESELPTDQSFRSHSV